MPRARASRDRARRPSSSSNARVRAVDRLDARRAGGHDQPREDVVEVVARIALGRAADRRDRDADRRAVVPGAEDQRLHPRRRGGDRLAGDQAGGVLDLGLDPDPADRQRAGQLDLGEQLVGHLDVAGRAHLRDHHRVEPVAGLLDHRDQVPVVVRRVGAVHAHHHGLAAEVLFAERGDHQLAGAVLLARRRRRPRGRGTPGRPRARPPWRGTVRWSRVRRGRCGGGACEPGTLTPSLPSPLRCALCCWPHSRCSWRPRRRAPPPP